MGKEWYWVGRSSKRGGGVGGGAEPQTQTTSSGCMCAFFQFFDFHPFHFQTMNHHQQHASFKPPSCLQEDPVTIVPKGAEAPRNSLESEDGNGTVSSSLSKEESFKIPKNIMQIKTSGSRRTSGSGGNLNDLSSEICNSPGIKTPTLVARLMGLDLLPGAHSPSSSSSSSSCLSTPNPQGNVPHLHHLRPKQYIQTKHRNSIDSSDIAAASRSLPDTPRISTARRSDADHYHHRLSLQINKENMNLGEDLELPRFPFSKRKCDENNSSSKSPSHYARQIVKQVKESVSRKVGQDITNTLKTREQERKEELVGQFRSKKCPKTSLKTIDETSQGKHLLNQSSSSCSPRLRFIDTKHKPNTTATSPLTPKDQNMLKLTPPPPQVNIQPQLPRVLTKPKPQALLAEQQQETQNKKSVPKCKKVTNERFNSRLKRPPQTSDIIRNKQEETFIIRQTSLTTRASDTKSKKTHPLSTNLLNNINNVPNLLPVKTDLSPSSTKIPPKQSQVSDTQESKSSTQLSSCSRQRYKQEGTSTLATREISNGSENKLNGASTIAEHRTPEFQYITRILTKEGTATTTKTRTWFSPTHPLDPSLFHHLERSNTHKDRTFSPKNQLGHRWNRRLMFDLADEVLKEILKPKGNGKRLWFLEGKNWYDGNMEGLIERVWKRVEELPRGKCEVLEDIDGLIEMEESEDENGIEEEGEGLVAEIEGNIWDTLVHETVMVMDSLDCCGGKGTETASFCGSGVSRDIVVGST